MPRALAVIAIVCLALTAHAQSRSPEVSALGLPLAVTTTIDRTSEHACSRSYAHDHASATLRLVIDRAGHAQLLLDGRYVDDMGPSPSAYFAGDRATTHLTELHRVTWLGAAVVARDALTVRFDRAEAASARFTGYGTMPLSPVTSSAFAGELGCAIERADVLPAVARSPETLTPMSILRCAWASDLPEPLEYYVQANFAMGLGNGLREEIVQTVFSPMPERHLRRAD